MSLGTGSQLIERLRSVVGAAHLLRYSGDHRDDVRLLSEAVVCELIAQRA